MIIGILSRSETLYSTRRLVEACQSRGHKAIVIDHTRLYVVLEKGKPHLYIGDHPVSQLDAIIPRIGASVTFYGAMIVRQFEMQKVFTTLGSLALQRSRDKLRALQLLTKAGVGIPKTAFAKYPGDIDNLIDQVGGAPLVVKLLEGTQGKGVVLAETKKAAESVIEAFYGLDANILIQEFIKESKGADLRVLVIGDKVVGAMKRQGLPGEFRSNLHKGGSGTVVKLSRKEKSAALKAAKALNLKIAGVDMLQSDRGPLIIEVNSSPGLRGIEGATGLDIAGDIVKYVEDNYHHSHTKKKDKIGV